MVWGADFLVYHDRCMRSTQHEGAFETNFLLECTGSKVNYLAFGIKKGPEAGVRYFFEICPAAKSIGFPNLLSERIRI
ncbi:hypothetical protein AcV7_005608 [Taiwanofungus camphoratus]|nr:hypothetical protein AcV7_005608 [Antrodia cinnamomea]